MQSSEPFARIDLDELDELIEEPAEPVPPPGRRHRRAGTEPVEKLDLNRASVEELELLPGLGPLRARRIIAWRNQSGPFESLEDLRFIRGLGERSVADLAPYVIVRANRR